MGNNDRSLFPGALEMMILQSLRRAPMHGYALAQLIKSTSEDLLEIEEGSLYPALQRLQIQGLVDSEWGQSANNRRARYYRLTRAGRRALGDAESSFDRLVSAIGRVMKPA